MRKHEKLYRIAIRIPLVALVVLTAAAFYWNPTAYRVFLPISAAVILLSLLVLMRADQALKRFAQDTGKRVEDAGELLRDLRQRVCELARVLQEGGDGADIEYARNRKAGAGCRRVRGLAL